MRVKLILAAVLWAGIAHAGNVDLFGKLKALPDVVDVVAMKTDSMFSAGYELRVRQPLDHANPGGPTFLQSVYVAHVDESKPVIFETEGYSVRGGGRPRELASLLRCNQIVVEHRFFGKSAPDSLQWKFLTIKQAAEDHHHIAVLLKTIYRGKWISSGVSKGGQTTLFYRFFFPLDVDASVAYVAPVNLSQEDPRIIKFLRTVGTAEEREMIREFQIALLKREKEILPLIDRIAEKEKLTFSIGKTMAYEYSVLEYPCAFWQYGSSTSSIPASDSPPDTMLGHLDRVARLFYYSDQGIKAYQPFQYQAYTEIGYYGYDITDFRGLLTAVKDPTNIILAPKHTDLTFNPATMFNVYAWLRDHGNNIIYIYGETDLWGSTAMELSGKSNAVKIVKPGGSHRTRIANLPPEERQRVYSALEEWLGITITR
jgi:hypothetical protein